MDLSPEAAKNFPEVSIIVERLTRAVIALVERVTL